MNHFSVAIIIPVYNEERIIAQTLTKLSAFLHAVPRTFTYKIVVVDNGSLDGTSSAVTAASKKLPHVSLLSHAERGKGGAIHFGWDQSSADILSFMDADLSSDLSFFPQLIDCIAVQGADLAIGSRLGRNSILISHKRTRKLASEVYNVLARALLGTQVADHQCGFKAISRAAYQRLQPHLTATDFFFDTELIAYARAGGLVIRELDIRWVDSSESKVHLIRDSVAMCFEMIRLRAKLAHTPV